MALRVDDLRFDYEGPLLQGIDLQVPAGRSGFLLGPSGAGKSTVLRCIAGLERDYQGSIQNDGRSLDALQPHQRRVGMLFQEPALFPNLDVARNVAFGLRYVDVPRKDHLREALHWLRLVGLEDKAARRVDALSGGERQRVALARTLAARPQAVLLDEPFAALDRPLREALGPRVKRILADMGIPALWVTHDEQEARALADVAWRMQGGRLVPLRRVRDAPRDD